MTKNIEISDRYFMSQALIEAKKCHKTGDVPVGAVIVKDNKIIAKGKNEIEKNKSSLAHAELLAIKNAIRANGYKHLLECTMYVTLEPCAMCSGAIVLARIPFLVIGASDPKTGASGSLYNITEDERLNHRCIITRGIMENDCSNVLKDFFKELRKK